MRIKKKKKKKNFIEKLSLSLSLSVVFNSFEQCSDQVFDYLSDDYWLNPMI